MQSLVPKNWFQNDIEGQVRNVSPPSISSKRQTKMLDYDMSASDGDENWNLDAVGGMKCGTCGSRKHGTHACDADLSKLRCFKSARSLDIFLLIARREEKENVERVTVDKSSKERANRKERKVKAKVKVLERKEK